MDRRLLDYNPESETFEAGTITLGEREWRGATDTEAVFDEAAEMELAAGLLEAKGEGELDRFLNDLIDRAGRAAGGVAQPAPQDALTGMGQLLGHCRGILGAVSSLTEQTELLRPPDAGVLKVAATPQTIDGVLSVFLARYARPRPNVRIELTEAVGTSLMATLERGEVHVAISTGGSHRGQQSFIRDNLAPAAGVCCGLQPCSQARERRDDGRSRPRITSASAARWQLRGARGV